MEEQAPHKRRIRPRYCYSLSIKAGLYIRIRIVLKAEIHIHISPSGMCFKSNRPAVWKAEWIKTYILICKSSPSLCTCWVSVGLSFNYCATKRARENDTRLFASITAQTATASENIIGKRYIVITSICTIIIIGIMDSNRMDCQVRRRIQNCPSHQQCIYTRTQYFLAFLQHLHKYHLHPHRLVQHHNHSNLQNYL